MISKEIIDDLEFASAEIETAHQRLSEAVRKLKEAKKPQPAPIGKQKALDILKECGLSNFILDHHGDTIISELSEVLNPLNGSQCMSELEALSHQWFYDNSGIEISVKIAGDLKKRLCVFREKHANNKK